MVPRGGEPWGHAVRDLVVVVSSRARSVWSEMGICFWQMFGQLRLGFFEQLLRFCAGVACLMLFEGAK